MKKFFNSISLMVLIVFTCIGEIAYTQFINPTQYEKVWVTVHSGDTYWGLCEKYGNDEEVRNTMAVSEKENVEAGTNINNLRSGETIVIYRRVDN